MEVSHRESHSELLQDSVFKIAENKTERKWVKIKEKTENTSG